MPRSFFNTKLGHIPHQWNNHNLKVFLSSFSSSSSSRSVRSMALTCHFSPKIVSAEKTSFVKKPFSKVLRLKHRHNSTIQVKKTVSPIKIRSSFKEKVFEDRSNGIICYADEIGEIVCEGYDEGPRFHQQIPRKSPHSRDSEIYDILQQRWINFVRGTELKPAYQKGVAVQGDNVNCNGFNSFR